MRSKSSFAKCSQDLFSAFTLQTIYQGAVKSLGAFKHTGTASITQESNILCNNVRKATAKKILENIEKISVLNQFFFSHWHSSDAHF